MEVNHEGINLHNHLHCCFLPLLVYIYSLQILIVNIIDFLHNVWPFGLFKIFFRKTYILLWFVLLLKGFEIRWMIKHCKKSTMSTIKIPRDPKSQQRQQLKSGGSLWILIVDVVDFYIIFDHSSYLKYWFKYSKLYVIFQISLVIK
jgi:hypothetical protein